VLDAADIEKNLISEIRLDPVQARAFLLVTLEGKMSVEEVASKLGIAPEVALETCQNLVKLGGFIDVAPAEFEAMHPRFTAVNMYRRMCERENIRFGRNKIVDGIGVILERYYDDARTK